MLTLSFRQPREKQVEDMPCLARPHPSKTAALMDAAPKNRLGVWAKSDDESKA